jgi:YidC/Oxa1 family membrane protein insertase
VQADAAEEKSVDTAVYRAVVSNVGAVLKSFQLKKYLDADGKPLELIDAYAAAQAGFPFAIATADPTLDKLLSEARFVLLGDGLKLSLEYRGQGIRARKTFDFDPERYLLTVSTDLQRNGVAVPHEIVLQGEFGDQANPDVPAKRHAVYEAGEKFHRLVVTGIKEPQDLTGTLTGVEDQYFLAMFLRDKVGPLKVKKQDYKLPDLADGTQGAVTSGLYLSIPSTEPTKVYIGPKLEQSLVQADPRLDKAIDYGWFLFAVIAKPLLIALRWLDGFIGNYGWSIIVLTVLLNMILFPLRVKQQLGMQKMQKNMPHLKQLQEKYKKLKPGDPKRAEVEKELMEINKQQLSGCLPMLLQFPLLLAFFNMITAATELRGAPWILWIKDLSQPDHLYILPILMGVAMFVQMKMSPTSPDPAQAKMMLITPVLVTILFLWYQSASGLTLYWLTGNVIGIVQQWFIRKYWSDDDKPRAQHRQPSPA